jgi:hypothetical protein
MIYLIDPKTICTSNNKCRPRCGIKPMYGIPTCRQIEI